MEQQEFPQSQETLSEKRQRLESELSQTIDCIEANMRLQIEARSPRSSEESSDFKENLDKYLKERAFLKNHLLSAEKQSESSQPKGLKSSAQYLRELQDKNDKKVERAFDILLESEMESLEHYQGEGTLYYEERELWEKARALRLELKTLDVN